jgi:hypothetical protein
MRSEVSLQQFRILILTGAALLAGASAAQAGPCTNQIAATQQQINQAAAAPPGGTGTPSAGQAIGAQLHHQPTPGEVANAEHRANAQGEAALEQAREADASGNADACTEALRQARRLYGLD